LAVAICGRLLDKLPGKILKGLLDLEFLTVSSCITASIYGFGHVLSY